MFTHQWPRTMALTTVIVMASIPQVALAGARAFANAQGGFVPPVPVVVNDPVVATATSSDRGAVANSFADAATGILRSSATAVSALGGVTFESTASSQIQDEIRFMGGFSQVAYLDYSFDGTIVLSGENVPHSTFGRLLIEISSVGSTNLSLNPDPQAPCPYQATCKVGTEIATTGSIPIVIQAGAFVFNINLVALAQAGNTADFSNTARLYLRTPDGVSFASASGQFLATASPIPELPTAALSLIGLGIMATGLRRRV
jgi:hypothetical protein